MKMGFLVRTGPYTSENVDTFYELSKRFLKKGHQVMVFLYEDGVVNVDRDIKSPQERNIAERMKELGNMGAEIRLCGTCAKFRGQTKADIIDEAKHAGIAYFVGLIKACDRFLSFGF
ncbi:MAG: DsrE family protein [Desulfobacterales bacterium]|nr:DsrE family protein [Desulfobacterales bacterium]